MSHPELPQISPEDLKSRLDAGESVYILDVRNPDEHAVGRLAESVLIPLAELAGRLHELDPEAEIIVHCKMGGRASQAVALLRQNGFAGAKNLTGGIRAWAERIDPSIRVV